MRTENLSKILDALAKAPEGLWIREIARKTGLKPMTVTYYVNKHPELFDDDAVPGAHKPVFRLVRLRKGALSRKSALLAKIMRELGP